MSKFKLILKFLFGGREGVIDYLFDCANNVVAQLVKGREEDFASIMASMHRLCETLRNIQWLVPQKWDNAYCETVSAFAAVIDTAADKQVTPDEVEEICIKFKLAYAAWREA